MQISVNKWHVELSLKGYIYESEHWLMYSIHGNQPDQNWVSQDSGLRMLEDAAVVIFKWWVLFLRGTVEVNLPFSALLLHGSHSGICPSLKI